MSDQLDGQPLAPDPVIEVYKRDVDRSLLRENLRRTVEERFERLVELQRFAAELKRAGLRAER
jgi:hypothetical protein